MEEGDEQVTLWQYLLAAKFRAIILISISHEPLPYNSSDANRPDNRGFSTTT
jgi:hypothetical protein